VDELLDLALVGHGGLGGDPDRLRLQLSAHAPSRLRTKAHGYHQPELERLAEAQRRCLDPARRHQLLVELQHLVAEDLPILPLYVPDRVIVVARQRVFDAWHFTPGGVQGGFPGSLNKHALISGQGHDV
jgi:peptide/nickel transport system substrate-binding protein